MLTANLGCVSFFSVFQFRFFFRVTKTEIPRLRRAERDVSMEQKDEKIKSSYNIF